MSTEILLQLISGLRQRIETLRESERLFVKAQGIDEQIEKSRANITKLDADTSGLKEELSELKAQKIKAMTETAVALSARMNQILPEGKAIFNITEDGKVFFGWKIGKNVKPYAGLSGGEQKVFDSALVYALGANIVIMEAAELDKNRLPAALSSLNKLDAQVICLTCHEPLGIPRGWNVVRLNGNST
jgi:hypothetical protein